MREQRQNWTFFKNNDRRRRRRRIFAFIIIWTAGPKQIRLADDKSASLFANEIRMISSARYPMCRAYGSFIFSFSAVLFVLIVSVTDAKSAVPAQEYCRSDSERGSSSSLENDVRPAEYSTRDSVTSLHYRSLTNQQAPPVLMPEAPVRPKHLQCAADVPSRKRFHTAPREKHRVSRLLKISFCDRSGVDVPLTFSTAAGRSTRLSER